MEDLGLAAPGKGGAFVQRLYEHMAAEGRLGPAPDEAKASSSSSGGGDGSSEASAAASASTANAAACPFRAVQDSLLQRSRACGVLPLNTHGGLLGHSAACDTPAGFSLIEAVCQLRGEAGQ